MKLKIHTGSSDQGFEADFLAEESAADKLLRYLKEGKR